MVVVDGHGERSYVRIRTSVVGADPDELLVLLEGEVLDLEVGVPVLDLVAGVDAPGLPGDVELVVEVNDVAAGRIHARAEPRPEEEAVLVEVGAYAKTEGVVGEAEVGQDEFDVLPGHGYARGAQPDEHLVDVPADVDENGVDSGAVVVEIWDVQLRRHRLLLRDEAPREAGGVEPAEVRVEEVDEVDRVGELGVEVEGLIGEDARGLWLGLERELGGLGVLRVEVRVDREEVVDVVGEQHREIGRVVVADDARAQDLGLDHEESAFGSVARAHEHPIELARLDRVVDEEGVDDDSPDEVVGVVAAHVGVDGHAHAEGRRREAQRF